MVDRLDGSLFTAANGYDGPGIGLPIGAYAIGLYGSWTAYFDEDDEASVQQMANEWGAWMALNAPDTLPFVYLIDEPPESAYATIEEWATWIDDSDDGADLAALATVSYSAAVNDRPSLDMPCKFASFAGTTETVAAAHAALEADPKRRTCIYNGMRPATGTFATEDDGIALRVAAWTQHKLGLDHWFYWESTYYDDYQSGSGQTDVFEEARTFGDDQGFDEVMGRTGWNYTNGDGVLFYPGMDLAFPESSYGVDGPFVSLRMKHWRRGLQDADYLALAAAVDPEATEAIVDQMIPEVLWEVGVSDPADPTWVRKDISWSNDPDLWELARGELAAIIVSSP